MFRILVVDDSAADVGVLQEVLKTLSRPYHVDWVKDGAEALDFLHRRVAYTKALRPDLVLMDMNMPLVDGLQALTAIKSDPKLTAIPVIMLSTSRSPIDVRRCYQAHANCYVQKPGSLDRSLRFVRAIESFWMDFAVLPTNDDAGTSAPDPYQLSSTPSHQQRAVLPPDARGTSIAKQISEARSRAMGTTQAQTDRNIGCQEHRRLLDAFGAAVQELLLLHEHQFVAIVQGDDECNRFDLLIHMANERKQQAKYDYLSHLESHGCSNFDELNQT